jgi:hypothetical protein
MKKSLADSLKGLDSRETAEVEAVLSSAEKRKQAGVDAPVAETKAKARSGKKLLLIPVEPSVHKILKHYAVDNERSLESVVREAIELFLDDKKTKNLL